MTKYILEIGLETNLDLFPLQRKIKDMFLKEIKNETFSNHVIVRMCQYEKIEDEFTQLNGINNGSGFGFHITDDKKPFKPVIEVGTK